MSDNCYKANLIDAQYEAFLQKEEEEAREIEIIHRIFAQRFDEARPECSEEDTQKVPMVPDLALSLVEIQNMRKRWADEDAALDFEMSLIPECSFDESWIDVCDWDTDSNINCGDWS